MKTANSRPVQSNSLIATGEFLGVDIDTIDSNIACISGLGVIGVESFFSGDKIKVPALHLTTPKAKELTIMDLRGMHSDFEGIHDETFRRMNKNSFLIKVIGMAVRIIDLSGADGMHHVHDTISPGTVYNSVSRSVKPHIARILNGTASDDLQSLGYLTSTSTPKHEKTLMKSLRRRR